MSRASAKPIAGANELARSLAMALSDSAQRSSVVRALQKASWADHKLDFAQFTATQPGRQLLSSAERVAGRPTSGFESEMQALPAMDFYVPFRHHRRTWRSTDNVLVAVSFDPDAPTLEAFDVQGNSIVLRLSDGVPERPLLIIHPAEPRVERAVSSREPMRAFALNCDPADTSCCDPEVVEMCEGPPSGGVVNTPGVYLTQFESYRGDGWWGSLEMEFYTYAWEQLPVYTTSGYWDYPGSYCSLGSAVRVLEACQSYTNFDILLSPQVTDVTAVGCSFTSTPRGYQVLFIESDGGLNGNDDDFGRRFFTTFQIGVPYGAVVGTALPYCDCSGNPNFQPPAHSGCSAQLSVVATVEYR